MMRAFIAITPPISLQQSFAEVRAMIGQHAFPWRWVQPAQVHVTLKFLGEVAPSLLDPIAHAMRRTVVSQTPFTLSVQEIGCFPSQSRPRILWMGLHDPQQQLTQLQQRLDAELTVLGFPPEERPFRPHLTLARAPHNTREQPQLAPLLQVYRGRSFGEIAVEHLQLLQSQLRREGAVYTLLRSIPLPDTSPQPQGMHPAGEGQTHARG